MTGFPHIFVADPKILYDYNFLAPLILIEKDNMLDFFPWFYLQHFWILRD